MLVIIDYNSGNLGSIANMFKRQGIKAQVSNDPAVISDATRLVLPGVGAFDHGIENLERLGLRDVLDRKVVKERVPIIGMCLGMQLMAKDSEEGEREGFGWIDAKCVHLRTFRENEAGGMKFPNIGWNFVYPAKEHPLLEGFDEQTRFYFVHTYKVVCANVADVLLRAKYGPIPYSAAFVQGNVAGVQFHPEKSHKFGRQVLSNFASWTPGSSDGEKQ